MRATVVLLVAGAAGVCGWAQLANDTNVDLRDAPFASGVPSMVWQDSLRTCASFPGLAVRCRIADGRWEDMSIGDRPVTAVAESSLGVLRGTSDGEIFLGESVLSMPRAGFLTALAVDPANNRLVYAGYEETEGEASVYRSFDGGRSWARARLIREPGNPPMEANASTVNGTDRTEE